MPTFALSQEHNPSERFGRVLLVVTLLELFLGGNGYLTQVAGIRIRVLLFGVCMAWVGVRLLSDSSARIHRAIWTLFFLFVGTTSIGILIGLLYGNSTVAIAAELKPLLYFPLILFFALAIRSIDDIDLVAKLIIVCGLVQAVAFVAVMLAVHAGVMSYTTLYLTLRESDEFIFRHNPEEEIFLGFFYKGAFHLAVAALFLLLYPVGRNFTFAVITIGALALTLTRGLIGAFVLSLLLGLALKERRSFVAIVASIAVLALCAYFAQVYGLLVRPESDAVRVEDFQIVREAVDLQMSLFGRGMGAPIGERERIEMTYLEVFYKQGLVGLIPWIILLFVIFSAYRNIHGVLRPRALVFVLAALYVYIATATNTFLTGSIGMSIVLLSTVSLLVMEEYSLRDSLELPSIGSIYRSDVPA